MVDYDPLIPAANDLISDSQADIQNNFAELNTLYDVDHQKWNAGTAAFRGKHKKMTFPQSYTSGTQPALGSDLAILFPQVDPNDTQSRTQIYYKNPTEVQQVTNRFHSASANGYIMLAGGIIYMWGNQVGPFGTGSQAFTFNTINNYTGAPVNRFPNNCFGVWTTAYNAAGDNTAKTIKIQTGSLSNTGYTGLISGGIDGFYWFAIGN